MKNVKIFFIALLGILFLSSCELWSSAVIPPDECFETDGETITKYDFENEKCPTDIIIPKKIRGTEITIIGQWAFVWDIDVIDYLRLYMLVKNVEKLLESKDEEDIQKLKKLYINTQEELLNITKSQGSTKNHTKNINRMQEIYFSDSITSIESEAFLGQDLRNVSFWKNLKKIWSSAFSLNRIKIADFSKVKNPIDIESQAFLFNYADEIILPKWTEFLEKTFDKYTNITYK